MTITARIARCALVALCAVGCARKVTGVGSASSGPAASTATLRLLERACEAEAIGQYRTLFTADYAFRLSPSDSAWSTTVWSRDDELQSAGHLFAGGTSDQPPAADYQVAFDRILVGMPDPESMAWDPGGRWHTTIRTHATVSVRTMNGDVIAFTSFERFSLVRGDSASVPPGLTPQEWPADSLHWCIRRWDELDVGGGAASSASSIARDPSLATASLAVPPALITTWGRLKLIYW